MSSVFEGFPTLMLSYCRNQFLSDSLLTTLLLVALTICCILTFLGWKLEKAACVEEHEPCDHVGGPNCMHPLRLHDTS